MGDFCLPRRKIKYTKKVISLTFQTNINLHMFQNNFAVKKEFLASTGVLSFFFAKTSETKLMNVASDEVNKILLVM